MITTELQLDDYLFSLFDMVYVPQRDLHCFWVTHRSHRQAAGARGHDMRQRICREHNAPLS